MTRSKTRKRPCSICRKWFTPDVRQQDRQKTCSGPCSKELHRRDCAKWNKQNSVYFKEIYLTHQLEKINEPSPSDNRSLIKGITDPPKSHILHNFPWNIFCHEVGMKHFFLINYLVLQILHHKRVKDTGFTWKLIDIGFQEAWWD